MVWEVADPYANIPYWHQGKGKAQRLVMDGVIDVGKAVSLLLVSPGEKVALCKV